MREGDIFDVIAGHCNWGWSGSFIITKIENHKVIMWLINDTTGSKIKTSVGKAEFERFIALGEIFPSKRNYVRRFIESL